MESASTHTTKATHLPQGTRPAGDLDLDSMTQPWAGGRREGGMLSDPATLETEKVPSATAGGVPAHRVRVPAIVPSGCVDPDEQFYYGPIVPAHTFQPGQKYGRLNIEIPASMEAEFKRVFGLLVEHGFMGFAGFDEVSGVLKIGAPHLFPIFNAEGDKVGSMVAAIRLAREGETL